MGNGWVFGETMMLLSLHGAVSKSHWHVIGIALALLACGPKGYRDQVRKWDFRVRKEDK
jgi:hypothetical protein